MVDFEPEFWEQILVNVGVNKLNCCIWVTEKPYEIQEIALEKKIVIVWVGIAPKRSFGKFYLQKA